LQFLAKCFFIGTPADIKAKDEAQTEAIEVEPFDERISVTILMVYGNSSVLGIKGLSAFSAKAPCPISLLPGPLKLPISPVDIFFYKFYSPEQHKVE